MSRYDLPGPKCKHVRQRGQGVRVASHEFYPGTDEPFASAWVCARTACVDDAKEWVWASTHRTPQTFPAPGETPA